MELSTFIKIAQNNQMRIDIEIHPEQSQGTVEMYK